jgi:CRP/FNR family cyclic AMP-dependent transcriptional regulator
MDLEQVLAGVDLFSGVDKKHLRRLARKVRIVKYNAEHEIVSEGQSGYHGGLGIMGVVLSGRLRVQHPGGEAFASIGPGEVFGEMSLLDDQARSATLVTEEPTEAAILSAWDFRNELQDNPEITLNLLRMLSRRLREARAEASGGSR